MNIDTINNTNFLNVISSPTFSWCFLLPLIHIFSLISNILCIVVFCSNVFIKKPIAIYFICLLISDSMTLLIGYMEMIDRESSMIDKSSWLCIFNEKIIQRLSEFLYTFMERFGLDWMLYKVLWTRVSTILLAMLSVQRTRTFFSLSYHESRLCAFFACIFSVIIALTITCLEWTHVHYGKVGNENIYSEIFHLVVNNNSSKEIYSTFLNRNYNESINVYPCMIEPFNVTSFAIITNQFNCSSIEITSQFANLTKSLLSHRDSQTDETIVNIFSNLFSDDFNLSNYPILMEQKQLARSSDFIIKLFETRISQIKINYRLWLKTYEFLNSLTLTFNRHALAIFFGNALPSFIVVLANLLSIKVIYFSKSLRYLKQTSRTNRRKRRLQNDLRAFLVIIIESFSIITISWGIPIFLTMYHCRTLYVISVPICPKIKDYLVLFLFSDLFNSATNCLLYSLSGKLFRRKLIRILKTILVCGRGTLWNVKRHSLLLPTQPHDQHPSNNPSANNNHHPFGIRSSRPGSYRRSERLSSPIIIHSNKKLNNSTKTSSTITYKRTNGQNYVSDDGSFSMGRTSDDYYGGKNSSSEIESDTTKKSKEILPRKSSQSLGSFLLDKVRSFGSTSSGSSKTNSVYHPSSTLTVEKPKIKSKKKILNSSTSKRQTPADLSLSTSSFTGSISYGSPRKQSWNNRHSLTKILITNTLDSPSTIKDGIHENLTSL